MSTQPVHNREHQARQIIGITIFAGILGFLFLLMPDGTLLTFLVSSAAMAGLVTSHKTLDERENQLLWKSYASAFEMLFFAVYLVYAFVVVSDGLHFASPITAFANTHWPGLVGSAMCLLVGIAAWRNFREI